MMNVTNRFDNWSNMYADKAMAEGWCLFAAYGVDDPCLPGRDYAVRLERLDESDKYGCDRDAWDVVKGRAMQGDVMCCEALSILEHGNPDEYRMIMGVR